MLRRMGGFDLALYTNSHNPVVATTLLLVFVFTMSMVSACMHMTVPVLRTLPGFSPPYPTINTRVYTRLP